MGGPLSHEGGSRASVVARLSIGQKLPLVTGALLVVLASALSAAAYVQVKRTVMGVATERLQVVTHQLADLLHASRGQLLAGVDSTARQAPLHAVLAAPGGRMRAQALRALSYNGPQPEGVLAVELRDGTGRLVLATGAGAGRVEQAGVAEAFPRPGASDSGAIGAFQVLGDSVIYAVAAPVPGPGRGYLVQWRRLTGSGRSRDQLTQLIGSAARLYVGNRDGSLWTDLTARVPAPMPTSRLAALVARGRPSEAAPDLASALGVPGTPWAVLVEFPRALVLAPATRFLQGLALITLVIVALGLLAAWALSRRITTPLAELSLAADAIAAGDYAHRVPLARADELGRLAASFDTMAATVEASQRQLEDRVAERTRELHEAQDALVRREKLAILGQLASGVGHELRNPLGVMTNAIYYLETVQASAPGEVKEYLQILRQQVALSEKIVNDLLDFARLKPPQHRTVALASLAERQLQRLGTPADVHVRLEVPEDLPAANVDPVQIGQVIFNLLANAVQAMGETGGELVVRGGRDGAGRVKLEVADAGPGVPAELREKIFEPLFTTKARGIGLGLAVSRSLAQANEGDLTLADASDGSRGATFVVWLPTA